MRKFNEDFLFGAATSSIQFEGHSSTNNKSQTTWDYWFKTNPELFYNEVGPENTSNFYELYDIDIDNMKRMNLNSFRTSISWARLLPDGHAINEEAIMFYTDVLTKLKEANIEVVLNLFHFDMPMWLMDKGGFESDEFITKFSYYASVAFSSFNHLVTKWTTFNEPHVHIECGYLYQYHYPCVVDFKRAIQVGYNTLMAHTFAVKIFKDNMYEGEIGIILNICPSYPKDSSIEHKQAAQIADAINVKSILDPVVLGRHNDLFIQILKDNDLLPQRIANDTKLINDYQVDFLGVNYYQPRRVQAKQQTVFPIQFPSDLYASYDWPQKKMNEYRGWEIYPKGIYDIAMLLKEEYRNIKWYVAENGMGVADEGRFRNEAGFIEDDYRIEFIEEHLAYVHQALADGSNCFGYHLWTFADCWSWLNAYRNRYGFFEVDLDNNYQRKPKKSSFWMAKLIKEGF